MGFLSRWPELARESRAAMVIQTQLERFQQEGFLNAESDAAEVTRATVALAVRQVPELIADKFDSVAQAAAILVTLLMQPTLSMNTKSICAATLARVLLEAHRDGRPRSDAETALLQCAGHLLVCFNETRRLVARPGH